MVRKRKCRIKLNDIMNEKLDSIEDDVSLDVFRPKVSKEKQFMDIAYEAMEQEEQIKNTGFGKRKNRVITTSSKGIGKGSVLWLIVLSFLFLLFVLVLWNIMF